MHLSKLDLLKFTIVAIFLIGIAVYSIAKLTRGPSTKDEVCTSFTDLGQKTLHANGLVDNAIFDQAKNLSDVAGRYEGQPSLADDAKALKHIGDSNVTNAAQLTNATRHIANLCGHPLLAVQFRP